jgi:hypothetical protein
MRSITGTLPYGLEVDGVVHAEFELRAAILNDSIEAIDELGAAGGVYRARRELLDMLHPLNIKTLSVETIVSICTDVMQKCAGGFAGDNNLKLSAAILARQITRLGTLDPKTITGKLLGTLSLEDWTALDVAAAEVAKKPQPPKSG